MSVGETFHLIVRGMRDEFHGGGAHHQQSGLEIAAGVGHLGVLLDDVEGTPDLGVAGHEGDAGGEKPDHRNNAECDDAGANRQL